MRDNAERKLVPCKVPLTISVVTLNAFIAWIMAAILQLEKQDVLYDMVELGILADQLEVWALSNEPGSHRPDRVTDEKWRLEMVSSCTSEYLWKGHRRATSAALGDGRTPHFAC